MVRYMTILKIALVAMVFLSFFLLTVMSTVGPEEIRSMGPLIAGVFL